jgi:hypothetical protein
MVVLKAPSSLSPRVVRALAAEPAHLRCLVRGDESGHLGFGRIVALHHGSSALYRTHSENRCLSC